MTCDPEPDVPWSPEEWAAVAEAAHAHTEAVLSEDAPVAASRALDLAEAIDVLIAAHGEHPVLLETLADFADGFSAQSSLYARADALAQAIGWPRCSILLDWAEKCVWSRQPATAAPLLAACAERVASCGDWSHRERLCILERAVALARQAG